MNRIETIARNDEINYLLLPRLLHINAANGRLSVIYLLIGD